MMMMGDGGGRGGRLLFAGNNNNNNPGLPGCWRRRRSFSFEWQSVHLFVFHFGVNFLWPRHFRSTSCLVKLLVGVCPWEADDDKNAPSLPPPTLSSNKQRDLLLLSTTRTAKGSNRLSLSFLLFASFCCRCVCWTEEGEEEMFRKAQSHN